MSNSKKIVISASVLLFICLVGAGVFTVGQKLWWFSGAYQQKNTADSFMQNVLKGDTEAAYKSTTPNLQSLNNYSVFKATFEGGKNTNAVIKPVAYQIKDKNSVIIAGTLTDAGLKKEKLFGVTVVKSPDDGKLKIDNIMVTDTDYQTAKSGIPSIFAALMRSNGKL